MRDKLLEQYKLCVLMADRVMQRKQLANIFFFAVNSVTIPLLIAFLIYAQHAVSLDLLSYLILGVSAVGAANCLAWGYLLQYYHRLSSAKYEVIRKMEEKFDYRPYCDEDAILKQGENKKTYRPLSAVESLAPLAFLLFYTGGGALALVYVAKSF